MGEKKETSVLYILNFVTRHFDALGMFAFIFSQRPMGKHQKLPTKHFLNNLEKKKREKKFKNHQTTFLFSFKMIPLTSTCWRIYSDRMPGNIHRGTRYSSCCQFQWCWYIWVYMSTVWVINCQSATGKCSHWTSFKKWQIQPILVILSKIRTKLRFC